MLEERLGTAEAERKALADTLRAARPPVAPRRVTETTAEASAGPTGEDEPVETSDEWDSAAPARNDGDSYSTPFDEDGPQWPDAAAEASFLAENGSAASSRTAPTTVDEAVDPKQLPTVDQLVARVHPSVREKLEELFRAKFVSVKRVPKGWLKEFAD